MNKAKLQSLAASEGWADLSWEDNQLWGFAQPNDVMKTPYGIVPGFRIRVMQQKQEIFVLSLSGLLFANPEIIEIPVNIQTSSINCPQNYLTKLLFERAVVEAEILTLVPQGIAMLKCFLFVKESKFGFDGENFKVCLSTKKENCFLESSLNFPRYRPHER